MGLLQHRGMICVVNQDPFDAVIESGQKVAEVVGVVLQTDVRKNCGVQETGAWFPKEECPTCDTCGVYLVEAPTPCCSCQAGEEDQIELSYQGCADCRPEAKIKRMNLLYVKNPEAEIDKLLSGN